MPTSTHLLPARLAVWHNPSLARHLPRYDHTRYQRMADRQRPISPAASRSSARCRASGTARFSMVIRDAPSAVFIEITGIASSAHCRSR